MSNYPIRKAPWNKIMDELADVPMDRRKKWKLRHMEQHLAWNRAYKKTERGKEVVKASNAGWRERNRDKWNAICRAANARSRAKKALEALSNVGGSEE
jgi:epoxyqueuosine reductase QueG